MYPDVTVIAPNGYVTVARDRNAKPFVSGIDPAIGEGQWITYRGEQIINTEKFTVGKEPSVTKELLRLRTE